MPSVIRPMTSGQRGLAAGAVGVEAEDDAADRPHHEGDAEGRGGEENRGVVVLAREEQFRDHDRHKTEDREVVPLERVADHGGDDGAQIRRPDYLRFACHEILPRLGRRLPRLYRPPGPNPVLDGFVALASVNRARTVIKRTKSALDREAGALVC